MWCAVWTRLGAGRYQHWPSAHRHVTVRALEAFAAGLQQAACLLPLVSQRDAAWEVMLASNSTGAYDLPRKDSAGRCFFLRAQGLNCRGTRENSHDTVHAPQAAQSRRGTLRLGLRLG